MSPEPPGDDAASAGVLPGLPESAGALEAAGAPDVAGPLAEFVVPDGGSSEVSGGVSGADGLLEWDGVSDGLVEVPPVGDEPPEGDEGFGEPGLVGEPDVVGDPPSSVPPPLPPPSSPP
ncbi:hypothetical protein GTW59_12175 [Streptomyces sp. SID89]|nr:hypothetical protein [Streptomyces sp. SID89]